MWTYVFISLEQMPSNGMLCDMVNLNLTFLRFCQILFQSDYAILHPHLEYLRVCH